MIDPSIQLQPHQQRIRDDASAAAQSGTPFKKMLFWGVGSGKTLGAVNATDALGGTSAVIAPAAVRPSFKAESIRALGQPGLPVFSYHGAAAGKVPEVNNLILDEAQRLSGPGASAQAVTSQAERTKNVMLLSGTPIRNHPSELASAVSILTGKHITPEEFSNRYVGTERVRPGGLLGWLRGEPAIEQPTLKHVKELRSLLDGKIDYYENTAPPPGAPANVKYEDVESNMTPTQSRLYEGMWGRLPFLTRWKLKFQYGLTDEELAKTRAFLTGPRQVALSDLPYRPDKNPLKSFENSGKLTSAFTRMTAKLEDPRAKGIVYSNFLHAGLRPYSAALTKAKIPHAIFHGGLNDEERKNLVQDFNSGKTRVALVGPAGAEGISLKGSQLIQLLDPAWNDARMRQAQARGIRFDSHTGLPDDLRDVTVERHVAKLPLGLTGRLLSALGVDRESQRATVDDYLRTLSTRKERLNTQMLDLLKDISAENQAHRKQGSTGITLDARIKDAAAWIADIDPGDRYLLGQLRQLLPDCFRTKEAISFEQLRLAKAQSDLGTPDGFANKTKILRQSIQSEPHAWKVDSVMPGGYVGITHTSGWRFHLPMAQVVDLMPQAAQAQPPVAAVA